VGHLDDAHSVARWTLRLLAHRHRALTVEIAAIDSVVAPLIRSHAGSILAVYGVGPEVAGALLVAAGDNPERLRSEASFAALCGVTPWAASSGKTQRHRLNRGGDRRGKTALWRIAMTPYELRRATSRIRPLANLRGPLEARDPPLPEAPHRSRDLPGAPTTGVDMT
jgi:transposase